MEGVAWTRQGAEPPPVALSTGLEDSPAEEVLTRLLGFCLLRRPNNPERAMEDAENLLQKYKGQEQELIVTLRVKYGQPTDEIQTKARRLVNARQKSAPVGAQEDQLPYKIDIEEKMHSLVKFRDTIVSRMQRQREVDDAMWAQVHTAARGALHSLREAQRQVAMQEVEIARLTSELSERRHEMEKREQTQDAAKRELASKVTRLQLTLMRLRGTLQENAGRVDTLSDIEYQKRLLNAERRGEEDLIRVYRRVLLQNITMYPLSPLREEVQRIDTELQQLMGGRPFDEMK